MAASGEKGQDCAAMSMIASIRNPDARNSPRGDREPRSRNGHTIDPRVRHFALQILAEWAQLSRDVKPEAWKHLELFSAFFEPRRQQVEALVKQTRPSRLLRRRLGV